MSMMLDVLVACRAHGGVLAGMRHVSQQLRDGRLLQEGPPH
jgi:hypothetical protein